MALQQLVGTAQDDAIRRVLYAHNPERWQMLYSAIARAYFNWHYRGQQSEIRRHHEQARAIREAFKALAEYRDVITHNLEGRVIHDPETGKRLTFAPWLIPDSSPVAAKHVWSAVESIALQLADDLENRNPEGMGDRQDRNLLFVIGREFGQAGLQWPGIGVMREIVDILDVKYTDDADLINAFKRGHSPAL